MADLGIDDILSGVEVKNRVVDGKTVITYNGKSIEWGPGEIKRMPRIVGEWFVYLKSFYRLNPGNSEEGIPQTYSYRLVILGDGQDESDLTREELSKVKELLDVENMPDLVRIDPTTGKPMRRVYIDPRSTGANDYAQRQRERAVTKEVSSRIVTAAAVEIAAAAQQASEGEIEAAVAELTGTASE